MKISFEKFGKNSDFWKSRIKFGQNGWRETSFFLHFLNSLAPRKRGKVRNSQNHEKSENHFQLYCMQFCCSIKITCVKTSQWTTLGLSRDWLYFAKTLSGFLIYKVGGFSRCSELPHMELNSKLNVTLCHSENGILYNRKS